jgi:hypothetical protein
MTMAITKRLPGEKLEAYFNDFSRRFLMRESTDVADVEALSPELGDQYVAENAHLIGLTYDPHTNALDIALEGGDHRAYRPKEIWTIEEDDGFIRAIEIIGEDNAREIVRIRRFSVRRAG